jgi:hypothetical protein
MDISGAFDNIDPEAIIRSMTQKGISENIVGWYKQYLVNRQILTDIKGCKASRRVRRGTPQGGVLSTMAWNLPFDGFLDMYKTGPIKALGYADDGSLLIRGVDPKLMIPKLQVAVDMAVAWGARNGLKFSKDKTEVVLFTRRYKIPSLPNIKLGGMDIPYAESVKYLGVRLDNKLLWNEHVENKVNKAKALLTLVKKAIGSYWGPNPMLTRWAYTGMVRPALTYGSLVWGQAVVTKVTLAKKLARVNRLACLMIGPVRTKTPSSAMEIIYDLAPLDLHIRGEAFKALLRTQGHSMIQWDGRGNGLQNGHRRAWQSEFSDTHLMEMPSDTMVKQVVWNKQFSVDTSSFRDGGGNVDAQIKVYTDGSKIKGKTG